MRRAVSVVVSLVLVLSLTACLPAHLSAQRMEQALRGESGVAEVTTSSSERRLTVGPSITTFVTLESDASPEETATIVETWYSVIPESTGNTLELEYPSDEGWPGMTIPGNPNEVGDAMAAAKQWSTLSLAYPGVTAYLDYGEVKVTVVLPEFESPGDAREITEQVRSVISGVEVPSSWSFEHTIETLPDTNVEVHVSGELPDESILTALDALDAPFHAALERGGVELMYSQDEYGTEIAIDLSPDSLLHVPGMDVPAALPSSDAWPVIASFLGAIDGADVVLDVSVFGTTVASLNRCNPPDARFPLDGEIWELAAATYCSP